MGKSKSKKYYAVCDGKGGFNGVLRSWEECKKMVHGVRGVKYKSFQELELAVSFVEAGARAPLPVAPGSGIAKMKKEHARRHTTYSSKNGRLEKAVQVSPVQQKSYNERFGDLPQKILRPKTAFVVYTDGACRNNGKSRARAGYGVFFGYGNKHNVSERLLGRATNQRAELFAVIVAMHIAVEKNLIPPGKGLLIKTDSQVL